MKKLLLFLLLLLMTSGKANATWATLQHRSNLSCGGVTTCAITGFTAIPAGSLIVGIPFNSGTSMVAATGASGGGTWVVPSGCSGNSDCHTANGAAGSIAFQYVLSSTGAPTTISTIATTSNTDLAEVFVFSYTSGPISFDVGASASRTTCTSCAGLALSPTGNDVIAQAVTCAQTCATSASAGFVGATPYSTGAGGVNDFPGGDGTGAAINQNSGTAPNWSQSPTGIVAVTAIAFKETTAAVTTPSPKKVQVY